MLTPEIPHRLHAAGERPIATELPGGRRVALVSESQRYIFIRCLEPALSTTVYSSVMREQTLSGTTAEYFRPGAMSIETFLQRGDRMTVLEIDEDHGFIHVTLEIIRGSRYTIDRVIPLNDLNANPHQFIVAPLHADDAIQEMDTNPPVPLLDNAAELENAQQEAITV